MSAPAEPRLAVLLRRLRDRPTVSARSQVLGRCERAALAAALHLRAQLGGTLTAIAVGPARREDRVLAVALRAGCDRALRVSDSGLEELDYLGRATALAAAVDRVGANLVLCGDRSQDELGGAIGPAVAELMSASHVTGVVDLRNPSLGAARADAVVEVAHRGDGAVHWLRCRAPLVLGVLRYEPPPEDADSDPTRGLTPPPRAAIEEVDLDSLGLERQHLEQRRALAGRIRPRREGKSSVTIVKSATDLVARLAEDHLLV